MNPAVRGVVLVVEADRGLGLALTEQLIADGYAVELAHTVKHARILARERPPTLALLGSLGEPRQTLELMEEIRHGGSAEVDWHCSLPAIVLGASAQPLDVLRAFDSGADDFLAQPAAYLELRARMTALLRRAEVRPLPTRVLEVGPLAIDLYARAASVSDHPILLRRMEFELLVALARDPARVCAREDLLRAVWGYRSDGTTRTLDSHASRLRRKLDVDGSRRWVINVWGVGYRLL